MMRTKAKRDMAFGGMAVALSAVFVIVMPSQVSDFSEGFGISGRTMPYFIAVLVGILGIKLVVASVRCLHALPTTTTPKDDAIWGGLRHIVMYLALITTYILGITYVGMFVSTLLVLPAAMYFSNERRPVHIIIVSLATAFSLWGIFVKLMQVPFPRGLLF